MKLQVLYFGELRERVGAASEHIEISLAAPKVAELLDTLIERGDPWHGALTSPEPLRVAVNQEMASLHTPLTDGAEVALFRPVTGG